MRVGRWILAIVVGLVLLGLAAVLAVTVFIDPNSYRGQIEAAVTKATGQPFRIKGDLVIAWYPWLALRMGPSEFGRVRGSGEPPILSWQTARVGAKLIPLTQGQLIIDRIRLEGPRFYLKRDADGRANWDEVIASLKENARAPAPTGPNPPPGPQVAGFEVRDGVLDYIDEGKKKHVHIGNWMLDVGEWRAGATFPVETAFVYNAAEQDKPVPAPGAPTPAAKGSGAAVTGSGVNARRSAPPARATAAQSASSKRAKGKPAAPPFELELRANARVHLSDDANDIDVFGLESTSTVRGGTLPAHGVPITAAMSRVAVRITPLDIGISEVSARVADAKLTASIQAGETGPDKALYARGPLSLQIPSVRKFLPQLGVEAPLPKDQGTVNALTFGSMWEWNDGAFSVNGIDLQLDETHFSGDLSRGKEESPVWTFNLHGDKIGLSRYTALDTKNPEPFELPVAALRALRMQGELTFEQAWVADAQMKNIRMKFELADGAVKSTR